MSTTQTTTNSKAKMTITIHSVNSESLTCTGSSLDFRGRTNLASGRTKLAALRAFLEACPMLTFSP